MSDGGVCVCVCECVEVWCTRSTEICVIIRFRMKSDFIYKLAVKQYIHRFGWPDYANGTSFGQEGVPSCRVHFVKSLVFKIGFRSVSSISISDISSSGTIHFCWNSKVQLFNVAVLRQPFRPFVAHVAI